jgi:hypothetical protein
VDGSAISGGVLDVGSSSSHYLEVDAGTTVTMAVTGDDGGDFDVTLDGESYADVGDEELITVTGPFSGDFDVRLYSSSFSSESYTISFLGDI